MSKQNLRLSSSQQYWVQFIALIAMTFDHLMHKLTPLAEWERLPGRIVLPVFAFLLAYNMLYRTRNKERYLGRLLLFLVLSQPIYVLYFEREWYQLNIFAPLLYGAGIIWLNEKLVSEKRLLKLLIIGYCLAFACSLSIFNSYSAIGPLAVVSSYYFLKHRTWYALGFLLFTILALNPSNLFRSVSGLVLTLTLFWLSKYGSDIRIPRWLGYGYYPVHIAALHIVFSWYGYSNFTLIG